MASEPPPPHSPPGLGPLDDPLAAWPNDDLLQTEAARDHFKRHFPEAMPVFDWPELRRRFDKHDPEASRFRQKSRSRGMIAAGCGLSSLLIAALSQLVPSSPADGIPLHWWMGLAAAFLAVAGGAIGYTGVLSGRTKLRWLTHRFWTERMRQLHFQLIANNLELAARVIAGDARARAQWDKLRAEIFDEFTHEMGRNQDRALQRMREDLAENDPWLSDSWTASPPPPAPSAALTRLFKLLNRQRFGIQRNYTGRKLHPGLYSPRTRLSWLRGAVDAMTILTLVLALTLGILLMTGEMPAAPVPRLLVAIGGALTACVMTLRMLEEGLQLRAEAERYEWYLAAVEALERRYASAGPALKAEILREMERLSYQELRRFTDSFCNARFVM